jgi:hypothetical protein
MPPPHSLLHTVRTHDTHCTHCMRASGDGRMTVRGCDAQLKFGPATPKFKLSAKVLLCVFCCAEKQLFRQVSCILGVQKSLVNVAVVCFQHAVLSFL